MEHTANDLSEVKIYLNIATISRKIKKKLMSLNCDISLSL